MTDSAPAAGTDDHSSQPAGDIIARPATSYRAKWCIMGLAVFVFGLWYARDGFSAWPEHNRLIEEAERNKQPPPKDLTKHTDLDIMLNKLFGIVLPPVGLFFVVWTMYRTRGEYRLVGDVLHVPGHPPVSFGDIRAIDQTKWDRKGIALIDYEVNGKPGRLKLDDYVYEREPTDQIYDRILVAVAPEEAADDVVSADTGS